MVKCKECPISEISLRRDARMNDDNEPQMHLLYRRYCRHFDKHVRPHKDIECEVGENAIKEMGPRKLYPFT